MVSNIFKISKRPSAIHYRSLAHFLIWPTILSPPNLPDTFKLMIMIITSLFMSTFSHIFSSSFFPLHFRTASDKSSDLSSKSSGASSSSSSSSSSDEDDEDSVQTNYCDKCDRAFATANLYRKHMAAGRHKNKKGLYSCVECGKQYTFLKALQSHEALHAKAAQASMGFGSSSDSGEWQH